MDAQHQHEADTDADATLRAAFKAMRRSPKNHTPDPAAFETVTAMCPALSSPETYADFQGIGRWGRLDHIQAVIRANDVPAVRELIRAEPDLLMYESPADWISPPLVLAVELGHHATINVLLKHRATVPPAMQGPLEYEDWGDRGSSGTPLTTACVMGRLDTLRLLLQGMPDADLNEVDNRGRTPFLAAASSHQGPPAKRVELIRFLLGRGADIQDVQAVQFVYDESLDEENDESEADGRYEFRPRPGGYGNALALAMKHPNTDPAVLTVLVEAGVNVYQSRAEPIDRVDKRNNWDNEKYERRIRQDWAFLSPMAIGAMNRNAVGVKTLLRLFPNDHFRLLATTDATLVPEPWPAPRDPDDDGVPVMLPLHAALLGHFIPFTSTRSSQRDGTAAAVEVVRLITADEAIRAATINTPYRRHYTPLHMATSFDRIPMLLTLIELGADLNVPRHDGHGLVLALFSSVSRLSPKPWSDSTAWAVAVDASTDMVAVLTTLLQRYHPRGQDADVDARNATTRRAVVNEADANGNTPLHFAVAYRLPRSTAALLALGARSDAANHAGQVPCAPPQYHLPTF